MLYLCYSERNMSVIEKNTHIECAIEIWKKAVSYDFFFYSSILHDVFKQFHVESKEQIDAFWKIFALTVREEKEVQFYYKSNNSVFDVALESKEGYKECKIEPSEFFLNDFDISDNVKSVISRTYRTLLCCKDIFPDDIVNINEKWEEDLYASISGQNEAQNSRWAEKDLIIQTALFIKRRSADLPQAQDLYFHITKSLLNAEYLIMDNYSKLLKDVIDLDGVKKGANFVLPCYVCSFVVVLQYLNEMCFRLKKTIFDKRVHRIVIDYHAEEYVANQFSACYLVGKDEMLKFDAYVKSLVDMTLMDHLYEINTSNIENLLLLWRRSEFISKSIIEEKYKQINRMVKEKVGNMIRSIVKKSSKGNNQCYFSLGNEHIDDIIQKINDETHLFEIESNPYLKKKNEYRNKELKQSDFDGVVMPYKTLSNFEDVYKYDRWAYDGWKSYVNNSKLIQAIDKLESENEESSIKEDSIKNLMGNIEEAMKLSPNTLTSSFYLKAIDLFCRVLTKKAEWVINGSEYDKDTDSKQFTSNTFDKLMGLLSTLLADFKSFTSSLYTDVCPVFIPPYSHSFYSEQADGQKLQQVLIPLSQNEKYDKSKFTNLFFYASLDVTLLTPDYFYDFIDDRTNLLNNLVFRRTSMISGQIDTKISGQKKHTDEAVNQMRSENLYTRNHTIQLLGLFAAFIALISGTIGSLRVAHSVPEFIIFLLALTFCIVVFSSLISFLGRRLMENNVSSGNGDKEKFHFREWITRSGHWDWFVPAGLAVLLLILLIILLAVYKIPSHTEETKGTPATSIWLQQHNNTTNQEIPTYPAKE